MSLGDRLLLIVLGALFAFVFSMAIQLWIVPRVDRRKRREERWERDVLALGEVLTAEVPALATAAQRDAYVMQRLHKDYADSDSPEDILRKTQEDASESIARYKAAARVRGAWLVDRIVSLDRAAVELAELERRWTRFNHQAAMCTFWNVPDRDFTDDKFDGDWERQDKALSELTAEVTTLARRSHPPRRSASKRLAESLGLSTLGRWWGRARRRESASGTGR